MFKRFSLILALTVFGTHAQAQRWERAALRSEDATLIHVDYQIVQPVFNGCYKCQQYTMAAPLWINVRNPRLRPTDKVRIVLVNFRSRRLTGERYLEGARELDLTYATGGGVHFTGELKALSIRDSGYAGDYEYEQEIAVVVNGQWLQDPISKSSNFKFKLSKN